MTFAAAAPGGDGKRGNQSPPMRRHLHWAVDPASRGIDGPLSVGAAVAVVISGCSPRHGDEEGRAVLQLKHGLDLALAKGAVAHKVGAASIMECTRQDLAGTCAAPVDEHCQGALCLCLPVVKDDTLHSNGR